MRNYIWHSLLFLLTLDMEEKIQLLKLLIWLILPIQWIVDRQFQTPELKIYPVNNNVEITEGSLDIIDDNLTVFCSYMKEDNSLMEDNFSGKNSGFQDRADYSKQVTTQTTAQSEDYSYTITSAQIHQMMIDNGDYSWDKGGQSCPI